jgi:hypothetical protein
MVDYLTRYYERGTDPFRTLSALPDDDALRIMAGLSSDTPFGERFKDPARYLRLRRQTEQWVRDEFVARGGRPQAAYPIPMVLGTSPWLESWVPPEYAPASLRIPLAAFDEGDVSFTYPDSMISLWFGRDRPADLYLPDLHGRVFTRSEILALVAARGLPEDGWDSRLPPDLAPYIEAQVWNHAALQAHRPSTAWAQPAQGTNRSQDEER